MPKPGTKLRNLPTKPAGPVGAERAQLRAVDAKLEQRLAQLDAKVAIALKQRLAETRTSILAWNFAFWITTLLAILSTRLL